MSEMDRIVFSHLKKQRAFLEADEAHYEETKLLMKENPFTPGADRAYLSLCGRDLDKKWKDFENECLENGYHPETFKSPYKLL